MVLVDQWIVTDLEPNYAQTPPPRHTQIKSLIVAVLRALDVDPVRNCATHI